MNDSHVPFYKTRKFWIVIYSVFLLASLFLLHGFVGDGLREGYWLFFDIVFSFGGGLFLFLAPEPYIGYLLGLLYVTIQIFLVKKTFQKGVVSLISPVISSLLFLTGIVIAFLY